LADATVEQLRSVPLFSAASDDELQSLAVRARRITFGPDKTILTEGQPGDGLYVLIEGSADVVIDGVAHHRASAGDILGEISMLGQGNATATVISRSDLVALFLSHDDFAAAVQHHGAIALRVIGILIGRMHGDQVRLAAYNRTLLDYIDQVKHITDAAAAVEASIFQPVMLDEVAGRGDELGQLARVFQKMAAEVEARERRLRQEVQRLRISIDQRRADEQVAAITDTDYFQELQRAADRLRSQGRGEG
jgi:CRP-like cAMP-binding protein